MPLPLTISCSSKSRLVLPSWFYLSMCRHCMIMKTFVPLLHC